MAKSLNTTELKYFYNRYIFNIFIFSSVKNARITNEAINVGGKKTRKLATVEHPRTAANLWLILFTGFMTFLYFSFSFLLSTFPLRHRRDPASLLRSQSRRDSSFPSTFPHTPFRSQFFHFFSIVRGVEICVRFPPLDVIAHFHPKSLNAPFDDSESCVFRKSSEWLDFPSGRNVKAPKICGNREDFEYV